MPGQQNYSKTFWLAYCDAIRSEIGTDLDDNTAIWYPTVAQRGPLAGPSNLIDPVYANLGIYEIGDNLLKTDSLFYVPSDENSYARTLLSYLSNVDLGGNPDQGPKVMLARRIQDEAAAKAMYDHEFASAIKYWKSCKEEGFIDPRETWYSWKVQNAPALSVAENQWQAASAAVGHMTQMIYGPKATQLMQDRSSLSTGIHSTNTPGRTMACTILSGPDSSSILRAVQAGNSSPAAVEDTYRPAYSAHTYADQVQAWMSSAGNRTSVQIDFGKGSEVDESSFNRTDANGGDNLSFAPWLSFGVDDDELSTHDQQKTKLTMSWDEEMATVNVASGVWDIKGKNYKLKADATPDVKGLARVVQFVAVSKIGFEAEFDGQAIEEFDQKFKKSSSRGDSIRLFGIPIGVDVSASTHTATWDKQSGKLNVHATEDGGFVTVIAVIGEKLDG